MTNDDQSSTAVRSLVALTWGLVLYAALLASCTDEPTATQVPAEQMSPGDSGSEALDTMVDAGMDSGPMTPVFVYDAGPDPASGLLLWYPFGDEGDEVVDHSGTESHGAVHGAVSAVEGPVGFGQGVQLSGRDAYIEIDPDFIRTVGRELTVAAWVKTDQRRVVIGPYTDLVLEGDHVGWGLRVDLNGRLVLVYNYELAGNPAHVSAADPIDDGTWHHVAGAVDSEGVRLYVDAVETASRPFADRNIRAHEDQSPALGVQLMGGFPTSESIPLQLDELRIYGDALSEVEVKALLVPSESQ